MPHDQNMLSDRAVQTSMRWEVTCANSTPVTIENRTHTAIEHVSSTPEATDRCDV